MMLMIGGNGEENEENNNQEGPQTRPEGDVGSATPPLPNNWNFLDFH